MCSQNIKKKKKKTIHITSYTYRHSTTLADNKNASQILLRVVFVNKIEIIRRMRRRRHEYTTIYFTYTLENTLLISNTILLLLLIIIDIMKQFFLSSYDDYIFEIKYQVAS